MSEYRKTRWMGSISALFICLLFSVEICLAVEIRVPGDYPTITAALSAANNGDTVRVCSGTYSKTTGESFPLRLDKPITLEGDPNNKPHLQGDKKHTGVLIETGGVTLRGFQITDCNGSEGINSMDGGGVCIFVGPSETNPVTIDNCIIEDNNCPSDETYDGCGGGIYCGGTYCTCFHIRISNCTIRNNSVHGCGGGVFCALLSNVDVNDTQIEGNTADDHGGGMFVDVYAIADMNDTHLVGNKCPGDDKKEYWGGKGGGLACESYGLLTATDCTFSQNTAKYFGGGIFTRGGLFEGEDLCGGGTAQFPQVSNSLIEKNHADVSGGGVYVASSGKICFSATTFYWNDAKQDGGAVFVAGRALGLDIEDINMVGCLLEGNESARNAGGIYLGQIALGRFNSTQFLGNSSLFDGGALFLDTEAVSNLDDCLLAYNNSARGYGGGLAVKQNAIVKMVHSSVVGNFAPRKRSGLYLDAGSVVNILDSILWRNAGGSIETNGAIVNISASLLEDGADTAEGVICSDPRYVGWGSLDEIYVDVSSFGPEIGTPASPYQNLQSALKGFDFHLASDSPCIGTAGDGGNMGADTDVVGSAGNITATLHIIDVNDDIRGRNIIFIRGVQGSDPNTSIIRHAVFGYIENAYIKDIAIKGEEIFGGITIRADVNFVNCTVSDNTALADGGGVYIAEGHCVMTNSLVSGNTCSGGNGGGIYLAPQVRLDMTSSRTEQNTATNGGGCFASSVTTNSVTQSSIIGNICSKYGAGLYLDINSGSSLQSSQVSNNLAHSSGGGIYVAGKLDITDSNISSNSVDSGDVRGGGINSIDTSDVTIIRCRFIANSAVWHGGGINSGGKLEIHDSEFESNVATWGGGIHFWGEPLGPSHCFDSEFRQNRANDQGGAIRLHSYTAPVFTNCEFTENKANYGGVGFCHAATNTTFDHCWFNSNEANIEGGSLCLWSTGSRFLGCTFSNNKSSSLEGGTVYFRGTDASLFSDCYVEKSFAGTNGGAFFLIEAAQPVFSNVQVVDSRATGNGGGIAIFGTSKPKFSNVTISNCQAVYGGGVCAGGQSSSIFHESDFRNNLALSSTISADGGGAFFTEEANGWFTRCVFHGNSATDDGGGMALAGVAKADLRNTLIAFNTALNTGGGTYFTSTSTGAFTNCTILSNKANGDNGGGGIYLDPTSKVTLDSSIICQNNPDGIRRQSNPIVSYSCVQETWPGLGNIECDVCLLDPNSFAPSDGSFCIDGGNPDPNMNDGCQPPGKGTPRNDMGITGGPENCALILSSDPNLVAWWTFDKIIGIWTLDSSGRGQHANLVNGPISVPGWLGGALNFDGVNDYVAATIDVSEKTYAMSLWFNTGAANGGLFSVTDWSGGSNDRHVYLTSGNLRARVWSDEVIRTIGKNYADGNWHCVVHTFDGVQSGQKLYVDGELKASGSKSSSDFYWQTEVRIGYSSDASQRYYWGKLDEVRVYNRSLNLLDAQRLANP